MMMTTHDHQEERQTSLQHVIIITIISITIHIRRASTMQPLLRLLLPPLQTKAVRCLQAWRTPWT